MRLAALALLCHRLEGTRSRNEKTRLVAEFLRQLPPDDIGWAVAFLTGRPFPASDPRVLEVSWVTLSRLLEGLAEPPTEATLELAEVGRAFEAAAAARGAGSRQARREVIGRLFADATEPERDVLRRVIHGEMRLGLQEGLLPEAIAAAAAVEPALVRRALLFVSDPAQVACIALTEGAEALRAMGPRLFVPLLPMLAEPAADLAAAMAAHGDRTALEWKYDGARIQLHKDGDQVRIWSRRLTEITDSLPEIVDDTRRELSAEVCILDGEVVAVGRDGRPLPFQDLMRRLRRVHAIQASAREIPLALALFDCLLLEGRSLIDEPYEARWRALESIAPRGWLARRLVAPDPAAGQAFLEEALAAGQEGLIAKALGSGYAPGARGRHWLKIKLAQTVDCVIVAADRGSGRRRGWLSNYHLAVRDGAGGFAPVGKTFKGLTDREFAEMTARLRTLAVGDDGYTVTVRPEIVVEVGFNEIQRSPQYRGGLALRFARITRIRDDKGPDQATGLDELLAWYERQFSTKARRDG